VARLGSASISAMGGITISRGCVARMRTGRVEDVWEGGKGEGGLK